MRSEVLPEPTKKASSADSNKQSSSKDADKSIDGAAMTRKLNLGDVHELIDDIFDDDPFVQVQFIHPGHKRFFMVLRSL